MRRALAAVATIFLVIYLPDIGHGFIADDFRWIVESRLQSTPDLISLFSGNVGFYRPVTSLSFAADHAVWGTNPFGYGLTNLALCLAGAGALFMVARRIGLPSAPALLASSVWLLNFHAINMAVLWSSGRTALLAAVFSLATAYAIFDARYLLGGGFALLAMLAKEEAVALPALFTVLCLAADRRAWTIARTGPLWAALLAYLALRMRSGAFWPADAPDYYRFSFSPGTLGRNVLEYADRAGTAFVIVAIVLVLATRTRWADVSGGERRTLLFSAVWIAGMYGLTIFLPVRSSLYALLPSLGSALAAGAVAAAAERRHPSRFRNAAVWLIVLAMALIPVYRTRNVRWVRVASLSEQAVRTIAADARGRVPGHVVLVDAPNERATFASAFGNLFPEALRLRVGDRWTGEIVNAPDGRSRESDLEYRLLDGSVRRESR